MKAYTILFITGLASGMAFVSESQEITNEMLRNVTIAVKEMCHIPDKQGEHYRVDVTGEGGAVVKLVGIKGKARFSKEEWNGIREVLPKDMPHDRESMRRCSLKLTPIIMDKFTQTSSRIEELPKLKYKVVDYDYAFFVDIINDGGDLEHLSGDIARLFKVSARKCGDVDHGYGYDFVQGGGWGGFNERKRGDIGGFNVTYENDIDWMTTLQQRLWNSGICLRSGTSQIFAQMKYEDVFGASHVKCFQFIYKIDVIHDDEGEGKSFPIVGKEGSADAIEIKERTRQICKKKIREARKYDLVDLDQVDRDEISKVARQIIYDMKM
jgi:hypothetical protein